MTDGAGSQRIAADAGELARLAAAEVLAHARRALVERGVFHVALAGGSTPRAAYRELARSGASFARWHAWFGDERCVPPDHPDSNYRMALEAWLGTVPAAPEVHRLRGEAPPEEEARRYAAELDQHLGPAPRLDLVLLGVGADGHTASLFPGSAALDSRSAVAVAHAPRPPVERLTLTLPVLNGARAVLFLVAGSDKRAALSAARSNAPGAPKIPAACVRPEGELLWLVDPAAAGSSAAGGGGSGGGI